VPSRLQQFIATRLKTLVGCAAGGSSFDALCYLCSRPCFIADCKTIQAGAQIGARRHRAKRGGSRDTSRWAAPACDDVNSKVTAFWFSFGVAVPSAQHISSCDTTTVTIVTVTVPRSCDTSMLSMVLRRTSSLGRPLFKSSPGAANSTRTPYSMSLQPGHLRWPMFQRLHRCVLPDPNVTRWAALQFPVLKHAGLGPAIYDVSTWPIPWKPLTPLRCILIDSSQFTAQTPVEFGVTHDKTPGGRSSAVRTMP
jgi:hypothetical protein